MTTQSKTLSITLALVALPALSQAFTLDNIEFWAGSGTQRSALVIQWQTGPAQPALVWGYRHDGAGASVETALRAFAKTTVGATTTPGLDARLYAYAGPAGGFGTPLYGIGYDLDGSGVTGTGFTTGTTIDDATPNDPTDLWRVGWAVNGFWSLHETTPGNTPGSWASAQTGITGAILGANSWHALVFAPAPNWSAQVSSNLSAAPIPEPATLAVLALLPLLARKRRKSA